MAGAIRQPSALDGVRVLELGGPRGQWAGKNLADYGADVIKIEPLNGDEGRRIGPFKDDVPHPDRSLYFWHHNTSKRSITLNLEHPKGVEVVRRLAESADVVLESFDPGYLAGIGLGFDVLSAKNPRLIMCSVTHFGQDGPWKDFKASDLVHQALGGQMASNGYDDPTVTGIAGGGGQAYLMAGSMAYCAILGALIERDRSGKGQYIDLPVHNVAAYTTELAVPFYIYRKMVVLRQTGRHAGNPRSAPLLYQCADGKYVHSNMPGLSLSQWLAFVEMLAQDIDVGDLRDVRFRDPMVRQQEEPYWRTYLQRWMALHPSDKVMNMGQQRKIPWGQVRAPEENLADPHFAQDRAFFPVVEHDELGEAYTYVGTPWPSTETPGVISRAPLLGEHNDQVYRDELGFTSADLGALRETGII